MNVAYLIEPPFNYVTTDGQVTGCDVALARHVCDAIGRPDVSFVETTFPELLPGLAAGRWQMTTGLFATAARRRIAQFSRPIWALADGLLVAAGNPLRLTGYRTIADNPTARLAVIRDQAQHQTALACGVAPQQITVFEDYRDAAAAVLRGDVSAYASVARAHRGFLQQNPNTALGSVPIPTAEKAPTGGAFAFGLDDDGLRSDVDTVLTTFLGSATHRDMVAAFGFSDADVSLVAGPV